MVNYFSEKLNPSDVSPYQRRGKRTIRSIYIHINSKEMGGVKLIVSDFLISFMWPWASILIKIFVYKPLGLGFEFKDDVFRCSISVINMFVFAWFSKLTKGGAYNPLMVLAPAMSGDSSTFLYTVGARIPAQVSHNL